MLNKLCAFIREQALIRPGDRVICAVSGGTDSVALLFALYLLREKLDITLEAAHFNHGLRGEESQRDEAFVRSFCRGYAIPLSVSSARVVPGKKGLEAAAREARYSFFSTLPGKVATAHTADDNAETLLMHLIRGTRLKGLGGIAPARGNVIRPMLTITREETEHFLTQWSLPHVEDSSNESDAFLRNRLRRHVMPLLYRENPRLGENLSRLALSLREDEACLSAGLGQTLPPVEALRAMPPALRRRALEAFLKTAGVREPEEAHVLLAEDLVFSQKPSARADFPGGVTIGRRYDRLEVLNRGLPPEPVRLTCPGTFRYGDFLVECFPGEQILNTEDTFTVQPVGELILRPRQSGDTIRLSGGSKSLKKLLIDRKIPAAQRPFLPVLSDDLGLVGVYSIGVSRDRAAKALPGVTVRLTNLHK